MISSCIKSVIFTHKQISAAMVNIISHTFVRVVSKNLPLENKLKWNGLVFTYM